MNDDITWTPQEMQDAIDYMERVWPNVIAVPERECILLWRWSQEANADFEKQMIWPLKR